MDEERRMHWRCNETPGSSGRLPPIIRIGDELQVPATPSQLNDIRKEARSRASLPPCPCPQP